MHRALGWWPSGFSSPALLWWFACSTNGWTLPEKPEHGLRVLERQNEGAGGRGEEEEEDTWEPASCVKHKKIPSVWEKTNVRLQLQVRSVVCLEVSYGLRAALWLDDNTLWSTIVKQKEGHAKSCVLSHSLKQQLASSEPMSPENTKHV